MSTFGTRLDRGGKNSQKLPKPLSRQRQRPFAHCPGRPPTRDMAEGSPTLTRMPSLANWVNPSASVSPRPSRESVSPEREQDAGITLIPTGRFGFPTQAMLAAVQAQREQEAEGSPPPSPPAEFAGVFKPRIKPKLPLDHVVMMHQAYVETNPVPKSWDEGPPVENGGASAEATSDAKGEHEKVAAPPKADKKESPVSPRKRKLPAAKKAPEVTRRVSRRLQA